MTTGSISLTRRDFERISEFVYRHCGINLHDGKEALVRARLAKRMRQCNEVRSASEYIDYVVSDAGREEFGALIDVISTNVTSFFREKSHFDYLRNEFLPSVSGAQRRGRRGRFRAWSAGCSSGEEAYSLAIALSEGFKSPANWDVRILATDISAGMLAAAREGIYRTDQVVPLNQQQRGRFLVPCDSTDGKAYQVSGELKDMVRYRYLNLMDSWPFTGSFDVIFCRNVMIYFDRKTQETLTSRFHDSLTTGGLLCIGHSESLTGARHRYRYVQPATYIKRN